MKMSCHATFCDTDMSLWNISLLLRCVEIIAFCTFWPLQTPRFIYVRHNVFGSY
ncbi:MAG: hypothetical protein ACOYK6_03115 [Chthoniobacterales bacterium]